VLDIPVIEFLPMQQLLAVLCVYNSSWKVQFP